MSWITPITDRTQADVDYALANQSSTIDLKGAWNISDVNRVIDNTIYIRDLLLQYGYVANITPQSHLTETSFPYVTSIIKVMKDNINALLSAYYTSGNPTISYDKYPNYTMANALELNLSITNDLIENMLLELRYTGIITCSNGNNILL